MMNRTERFCMSFDRCRFGIRWNRQFRFGEKYGKKKPSEPNRWFAPISSLYNSTRGNLVGNFIFEWWNEKEKCTKVPCTRIELGQVRSIFIPIISQPHKLTHIFTQITHIYIMAHTRYTFSVCVNPTKRCDCITICDWLIVIAFIPLWWKFSHNNIIN